MGEQATSISDSEAGYLAAAFRQAIEAAREFEGATAPNPPVGCVLLDAYHNVLAVAAHPKAGTLHAEALAIERCRAAGLIERVHTVVVTLEPCNHFGRTPPCADAILSTPAKQVWIGVADPNPSVVGGGSDKLRLAGLSVDYIGNLPRSDAAELAAAARRLIAPFAKRSRTGVPWVTVKQALDRCGGMIPPAGRKTFTSPSSLVFAHRLRKRADAILTGSGTVLADAPEFTVRHVPDFTGKRRALLIADRRSRVPDPYLAAAHRRGFAATRETSIQQALRRLGEAGALEVLVEAGPTLTAEILGAGLWDEHVVITQGATPGGEDRVAIHSRRPDAVNLERTEHVFWDC